MSLIFDNELLGTVTFQLFIRRFSGFQQHLNMCLQGVLQNTIKF